MKSRKILLKKSQLYLILDRPTLGKRSLNKIYSAALGKQIGLIQLRDKKSAQSKVLKLATKLAKDLKNSQTLFIVNDDLNVAVASRADGVHLGQDDLSLKQARKILGKKMIIGISCHNLSQALKAQKEGADYIGIGPVFPTATKPKLKAIGLKVLRQLKDKIRIPYFAIGDICAGNLKKVIATGTKRIAVCRAIIKVKNSKKATEQLIKILNP